MLRYDQWICFYFSNILEYYESSFICSMWILWFSVYLLMYLRILIWTGYISNEMGENDPEW
jgi:hypothetical protein